MRGVTPAGDQLGEITLAEVHSTWQACWVDQAPSERAVTPQARRRMNRPGFGGGSLVESQATRLIRSPSSYRASNSVGGLYPQAP